MEWLSSFADLVLHLDKHLVFFVQQYGDWVYALLFAIIFTETGVVIAPFLPGDSLLFVAGALCVTEGMSLPLLMALLIVAAILGDAVNYSVGRWFGEALMTRTRLISPEKIEYTQHFFEKHGPKTIVIARFLPIVRTMAPFVAGFSGMQARRFLTYNVSGGILWVVSLTVAGYLFGNIPLVKNNLTAVILLIIFLSILPGIIAYLKARSAGKSGS
ncbi:MAG: DedA family protein [Rhodocyclaceae bacterium]|jgi:membrane-associated protein|nr:DedA family protein [Rhodocyclaceae bacterium]